MNELEKIKTIEKYCEAEYKEKGSVFIGQSFPIDSENEFSDILDSVKKKYYDATHHCYAYKLLDGNFKYSDDGEPNGTAGIRILNAIEHYDLTSVLVIVIRFYGGTKLGVGPLGKAYYSSAFNSLSASRIITKYAYHNLIITSDFNNINHVHRILSNHEAKIIDSTYSENATFNCLVFPKDIESITYQLTEASKGSIQIKLGENIQYL